MMKNKLFPLIALFLMMLACSTVSRVNTVTPDPTTPAGTAQTIAAAEPGLPRAEIANDEGGPAFVTGDFNYTSYAVATHFLEPVVALMDMSRQVRGDYTEWVPRTGQILGTLTSPLAPSPASFRIDVPVQPGGASVDLDNDGEQDAGVQIYAVVVGSNLVGDSYLEQIEQSYYASILSDPQTGAIREGALLVYAPDDAQGFPAAAGEDGQYFTADDPAVALPAGYTLATLGRDGEVIFDRAREARMDTLEEAAMASPDFSDQGILESYNSLIDLLKERYSYTELRGLDWEQIRETYLSQVQVADATEDMTAYYLALNDLALSIHDAHVYVSSENHQLSSAPVLKIVQEYDGNLGAQVVEMSDGRFILVFVDPQGPGAQAGWQFGTEIITVDGVALKDRLKTLPLLDAQSTTEGIRLAQMKFIFAFPSGTETTVVYRQPGEDELRSAALTAGAYQNEAPAAPSVREEISFKELDSGYGYIQWTGFNDPLYKIAVFEKFLSRFQAAPGVVIDLRDNGGGSIDLMYTLLSYFFTAENPAALQWIDTYAYDAKVGDLVKELDTGYLLSAPKPELAYEGAVVVLVNEGTASAGEYFPQFLQRQGRAIVAGEHGTEGAGGVIERAALPGGISFTFTKGRSFFAGTDELNLEAKGVTLDVRVPVTEENERAKQEGRDPVLEAALVALGDEAARRASARLIGTTWQLTLQVDTSAAKNEIANPESYSITFGEDGEMPIQADCNRAMAQYEFGAAGALTITPGPATLAACPEGSLGEDFLRWLGATTGFQTNGKILVLSVNPESGALLLEFEPAGGK